MARFSHEIRTSLTGIVGYAEFLETGTAEPMMNFTAKIIRESGLNLLRASHAYLDLQYLMSGTLTTNGMPFLLADALHELVAKNQSKARERDVRLILNCATETKTTWINTDAERQIQALDALVFDALETAEKLGYVLVELQADQQTKHLVLTIEVTPNVSQNAPTDLHADFWRQTDYRFLLQQGPGVDLAMAKAMLHFLGVSTHYQSLKGQATKLTLKFPLDEKN